jgi:hypothetical protein
VPVLRRHAAGIVAIVVVVVTAGVVTVAASPDSLAWTTPPFTPSYATVTNSDVDWGQSLYLLQQWSRGKAPWVAYFGPRGLGGSPVTGARPLLGQHPAGVTGWVAVSATDLTSAERASLSWLRAYCPVQVLGGSILVYRFDAPPSATAGPSTPVGPCPSGTARFSTRTG